MIKPIKIGINIFSCRLYDEALLSRNIPKISNNELTPPARKANCITPRSPFPINFFIYRNVPDNKNASDKKYMTNILIAVTNPAIKLQSVNINRKHNNNIEI